MILYHRRKNLSDPRIKLQFGFLYDGYEADYYYWEFWVMMRKVLVIFVSVFLSQLGIATQSLGATLITFLALYVHLRTLPYEDPLLDRLEQYSLVTCFFTMYCGLFFFHDEIDASGKYILIALIFMGNGAFVYSFFKLLLAEIKTKARKMLSSTKDKFRSSTNRGGNASRVSTNKKIFGGAVKSTTVIPIHETEGISTGVVPVANNASSTTTVLPMVQETQEEEEPDVWMSPRN